MNLQDLGALGEVIAAFAVVISLFFVTIQLRSNTRALRASMYQAIHDGEDLLWGDLSRDGALANLWQQSASGLSGILDADRPRAQMLLNRAVFMIQHTHYQRRRGFVDDEMWRNWQVSWTGMISQHQGVREMFERNVVVLSPHFVTFTRECLQDADRGEGGSATMT